MDQLTDTEITDMLDEVEETIAQAVECSRQLASLLKRKGFRGDGARLEAYLIPHLECWITDADQCGSIASIREHGLGD